MISEINCLAIFTNGLYSVQHLRNILKIFEKFCEDFERKA